MKELTITIKNNKTGDQEIFETNGIMGAFINKEYGKGKSDTSQFMMGNISNKEFLKLLSGCLNLVYFTQEDIETAEKAILVSKTIAKQAYQENAYWKDM